MASCERIIEIVKECESNNRLWLREKTFCELAQKSVIHSKRDCICFKYKGKKCEWEIYLSICKAELFKNKQAFALVERILITEPYIYLYTTPNASSVTDDFLL